MIDYLFNRRWDKELSDKKSEESLHDMVNKALGKLRKTHPEIFDKKYEGRKHR